MRTRLFTPVIVAALLVASCHRQARKPVDLVDVLPNIPLPPDPEPLVRQGGVDAIQFVVVSRDSPDSVVAYYRKVLANDPFRLINERKAGSTTAFYAEQAGPSIWITVSPNGSEGSQVIIAGATDSVKAANKKP